jgi:hypothetical protein
MPVVSIVTTDETACTDPEYDESADAAATVPSAHGNALFSVESTSDTHLVLPRLPLYVSSSVVTDAMWPVVV